MRAQPTQQRSRQTVRALLRAADTEFAEHGFDGAQMTRIAQRANASVGSMYRFFPDKNSFARALVADYGEVMLDAYNEVLGREAQNGNIEQATRRLVRAAANLQLDHAGYYRLTSTVTPGDEASPGHAVRQALVRTLVDGLVVQGVVDPDKADDAVVVLDFALEATRARMATLPRTGERRELLIAELEEMITAYIMTRFGLVGR